MATVLLNRVASSAMPETRKIKLPIPCLTLMGVEIAHQFGVTDANGEPIIPNERYSKRFDPVKFLLYYPYDATPLVDTEVLLPRKATQLRSIGNDAEDITDGLTTAARDLIGAIRSYEERYFVTERLSDGSTRQVEKKVTSPRIEANKSMLRSGIQKAFLNYQFKQMLELRRVLKKNVFQVTHPGCNAPLVCDPTLGLDQIRIPAEIFDIFKDCDALVLRHPVLETVYRLRPVKGSDMVIAINSLLLTALHGDVDGDSLFVTPVPRELDGGVLSRGHEVYDEADVLLHELQGDARNLPVSIPPLNLHDFGPESENSRFVGMHKIRNFGKAIWAPMDHETYFTESLAAAGRFRWEKDSIGKADSIRRALIVMTDDTDEIRSINSFCGAVSQKAIDAGKHREEFPLDNYMMAFNCQFVAEKFDGTPYMARFKDEIEMAQTLVLLTGLPELSADALRISHMLFAWPEFSELGMKKLIERYFPWQAFSSIKRIETPRSEKMMTEARILTRLDSAIAGQSNFWW